MYNSAKVAVNIFEGGLSFFRKRLLLGNNSCFFVLKLLRIGLFKIFLMLIVKYDGLSLTFGAVHVGNLRVLLSASSAFVNLRVRKRLNEHSRHFSGGLSVTFDHYR